jgi:hypothetical protein
MALNSFKTLRTMLKNENLAPFVLEEAGPGAEVQSDEEILE